MQSLQGQLLIAAPTLVDPNFVRAVVLIIEHNDEGAWGLVLNRQTDTPVADAWEQVSQVPCASEQMLHHGGPCEGPLMVVHKRGDIGGAEPLDGVFVAVDSDDVEQLVGCDDEAMAFYVGYAGWGAGQLEEEIESGSWLSCPASDAHLFDPGDDPWGVLTKQVARAEALKGLNPKIIPKDPSMN